MVSVLALALSVLALLTSLPVVTSPRRPVTVCRVLCLQQYLSGDEFLELFQMTPEEFYFLAEWKRNDIKKRVDLF